MRTALFFDGKNFYSAWRDSTNRQQLDFVKLSQWLVTEAGGTRLWAAHYYTGVESGNEAAESQGQQSLGRFLDWLDEQPGFFVQRFPRRPRSITCDHCGGSVIEWAARVTAWQRSGQTAVEFCKPPRCWDPAQLRWWRWKLERRGALVVRAAPEDTPERDVATPTFLRLVASHEVDCDDHAPPHTTTASYSAP